jgi:hypothetical protein
MIILSNPRKNAPAQRINKTLPKELLDIITSNATKSNTMPICLKFFSITFKAGAVASQIKLKIAIVRPITNPSIDSTMGPNVFIIYKRAASSTIQDMLLSSLQG